MFALLSTAIDHARLKLLYILRVYTLLLRVAIQ